MKLILPYIDFIIEEQDKYIHELIVENQKLMYDILSDLHGQIDGRTGKVVLSDENKPIDISKNLEVIDRFIPFDINKRSILNRIAAELEAKSSEAYIYPRTVELLSEIEKYLVDLSFGQVGDIQFDSINVTSIIKASGMSINEEYNSLSEKIIDYIELVTEYDRRKLFVLVGARGYIDDMEMAAFVDTVIKHNYKLVLIEPSERVAIDGLKRYIIDKDLCEIG